jgi:N-acetyl-anhydromuramyl-L-alanine amidase AmpD
MKADRITLIEEKFDGDGRDTQGFTHAMSKHSTTINDQFGSTEMHFVDASLTSGDDSYFYPQAIAKDQIVLHYTIGYLPGDIATLTQNNCHVSVPFIIGRNGTIYNLFSSKYWAYHLGRGAIGGNKKRSSRSIGVELSNIGPLIRQGDELHTIYGDEYCTLKDVDLYQPCDYRGFEYFATTTEAQYQSLNILLRYLTAQYNIPRRFLDKQQRFKSCKDIAEFSGIVSHANYRTTGKSDIGPAFEWDRVISELAATEEKLSRAVLS